MSRQPKINAPGTLHPAMGRGIRRTKLFRKRREGEDFFSTAGAMPGRLLESDLRSPRRKRKISRGRRLFCQLAVGKRGYPGAEVAKYLGVTTSAVIRAVCLEKLPEL